MRWPLIRLLPKETHFRFVRYAPYAAVISAILVLVSCGSFVLNGLNFGTDFRGGFELEERAVVEGAEFSGGFVAEHAAAATVGELVVATIFGTIFDIWGAGSGVFAAHGVLDSCWNSRPRTRSRFVGRGGRTAWPWRLLR